MIIAFEDFIKPNTMVEFMQLYFQDDPKTKLKLVSGAVTHKKLNICINIMQSASNPDIIFVMQRENMTEEIVAHFHQLFFKGGRKKRWNMACLSKTQTSFIDIYDNCTYRGFCRCLDKLASRDADGEDDECLVCFGKQKIKKCVNCSAFYCPKCATASKKFRCHACGIELLSEKRCDGSVSLSTGEMLGARIGALKFICKKKFGVDIHIHTKMNGLQIMKEIFAIGDPILDYFDHKKLLSTVEVMGYVPSAS